MAEKQSFTIQNEAQLSTIVSALTDLMNSRPKLVFLYGDLGAGKTTLVKAVAKYLGSSDDTSSPTYALVNEYEVSTGAMYHIDLYRINDTEEALDMGIEEYIFSDHPCFVEWPQVIEPLVDEYIKIIIEADENGERQFEIETVRG